MARPAYLDEKKTRRAIIEWLGRKGYGRNLREKATDEHGVDIRVRHNRYARYFLVEVKGDANPKTVKRASSKREVSFLGALGQIATRMNTKAGYHYALGFPSSYESKVKVRLPWIFCKKNNLQVLLVNPLGKVRALTWRDLKKHQGS